MQKTAIILLLGITTVSLLGLCLVQRQQIQRLSANRASIEPSVEAETTAQHKQPSSVAQKSKEEAGSPVPQTVAEVKEMPAETKVETVATNESPMAEIAKIMKNPGMKEMIRAQQKGQMELMYGSLFKCLQLSDTELETLKGVLLDKQMALVDISMDLMNKSATPEERKAAETRMKELTAEYDTQLKALLGDDNYTVYQSFEATQAERMQVSMFKGSLNAGDQMTDEQEDNLVRAMHDARNNFQSSAPGFGDKPNADPDQFTPEKIAKLLEDSAKLQEQYVARAAAILTPSQLELFKANQKQQLAMQEMGMKMAAKMFGQPAK